MYIDFMGTDAAVFRSLSRRNAVRTDQHNSKWLSGEDASPLTSNASPLQRPDLCRFSLAEPVFVDAHLLPDGSHPNDSKLYFFFRERLTDNSGRTRDIHSMVARVCPVRLRLRAPPSGFRSPGGRVTASSSSAERRRGAAQPGQQVDHLPEGQDGVLRPGGGRHRDPLRRAG